MSNIHLKLRILHGLLVVLFAIPACAAEEQPKAFDAENDARCIAARNGTLDVNKLDAQANNESISRRNAFLFDCAVQVTIAGPKDSKTERQELRAKKRQIAGQLLLMDIDTSYVNQYGNTLLMSVVMSYLPLDWKLTTSRKLVESGVDVNHTNDYSKSALDLAKQKQEDQLVQLLSSK